MPDRQQGTITATATEIEIEIEMAATAAVVAAAITTIIITVTVTVIVKRRGPSFSLSNVLFSSSSYLYLATCNWQLVSRGLLPLPPLSSCVASQILIARGVGRAVLANSTKRVQISLAALASPSHWLAGRLANLLA